MSGGIFVSAGEASGDLHGATLARALRERAPDQPLFGMGGGGMETAGVDLIVRNDEMAVTGIFEVASHMRTIYHAFHRLLDEVRLRKPALAILIDYPDFNLRLAAKLRSMSIPVVYYISPQVWAWRRGRVHRIRKLVDHMIVILPFEERPYQEAGVPVTYVGHPLADIVRPSTNRETFRARLGLDGEDPVLAMLPGSRLKEVRRHRPVLAESLRRMRGRTRAIVVRAPTISKSAIEALAPGLTIVEDAAYDALTHADLVLTSCGTATLETALCGTPMIAFYRLSPLTYLVGRPLVRTRTYAMCNILAGEPVVPELIQGDFTPDRMAVEADRLLGDPTCLAEMRRRLAALRQVLGAPGAAGRAADVALRVAGLRDS